MRVADRTIKSFSDVGRKYRSKFIEGRIYLFPRIFDEVPGFRYPSLPGRTDLLKVKTQQFQVCILFFHNVAAIIDVSLRKPIQEMIASSRPKKCFGWDFQSTADYFSELVQRFLWLIGGKQGATQQEFRFQVIRVLEQMVIQ